MVGDFHKGSHLKRVYGAIRFGGWIGIAGLFYHLISPFTRFVDKIFHHKKILPDLPVRGVFIVGSPRSGTTVLFQAISETFQSIPYTNAHYLFPVSGSDMYRRRPKNGKTGNGQFNSYHGYTLSLRGVNEGNDIFGWVHDEGDQQHDKKSFERILATLDPQSGEIIILKNIRSFNKIFRIYQASKGHQLIFVRVKRDIKELVESSIDVYHETGSFHPVPDSMRGKEVDNPIEFAVNQILGIEDEIEKEFARIPDGSKYLINYQDFCEDPEKYLRDLHNKFSNKSEIGFTPSQTLLNIKRSQREKVNAKEAEQIEEFLRRRTFEKELNKN